MSIFAVMPDLLRYSANALELPRIRHYLVIHRGARSASGITSSMFCWAATVQHARLHAEIRRPRRMDGDPMRTGPDAAASGVLGPP